MGMLNGQNALLTIAFWKFEESFLLFEGVDN